MRPGVPLSRRRAVATLAAALAGAIGRVGAAAAQGPYSGPLVDAHAHLRADAPLDPAGLLELYDAAGVRGCWLFGEPWSLATAARDQFPTRVVPFLAEGYANALHPDSSYVNPGGLEQLLDGGFVRGLGEVICRHSAFQLGPSGGYAAYPATNVPADHPLLLEAYRLAGRYGAVVTLHQEWWHADELSRALAAAPETSFVWAHAGHGPPGAVRPLLERHPNLHADLSARTPWLGPGTVLSRPDGTLSADWRALLHDHPDRFLVGLDLFVPAHYRAAYVSQVVAYTRALLGQLDPAVAALIGHANAERLAPWTPRT